jgi:hypothetical protein
VVVIRVHSFRGARTMRDLTVANIHTYYVMAGNTPVFVHNSSCDIPNGSSGGPGADNEFLQAC